jgi:hypothetical protein
MQSPRAHATHSIDQRKKKIYTGLKDDDFFVVTMEHPMEYSDVLLVDPVSNKPVETVFRFLADGRQVRLGVGPNASDQIILIPERPDKAAKAGIQGPKDTSEAEARQNTYDANAPFPFRSSRPSIPQSIDEADHPVGVAVGGSKSRERISLWQNPGAAQTIPPSSSRLTFSTFASHSALK